MTKKIFHSIFGAAGIVLLVSSAILAGYLYHYFGRLQENQLKEELEFAAAALEGEGASYLERLSSDRYRLTWIGKDGTVIFDTQTGAFGMENHAGRKEVQEALQEGEGKSVRYSATLLEKTMYYARALKDGSVLRISVNRNTIAILAMGMTGPLLLILAFSLFLSAMLAKRLSGRIVEPLNNLDLEHPLDNEVYEELSPLLCRIHNQHKEIAEQYHELIRKTDEFDQIIRSMKESLVLLDNRGIILSINPAAMKLFGADPSCVGKEFLMVDRNYDMSQAIRRAFGEGHGELRASRGGREYQFDISRIESGQEPMGAVLLAFDVTEQALAEQSRREFTANVSHELKTPLQGIMGSTELIENGMVKQEDMPRFVGHIRKEASRLVALVEDIIRLSELDEGSIAPMEREDLLEIAREAAAALEDAAGVRGVELSVTGEPVFVIGVRRLLYEIIYNLCDNAVKYNIQGGRVEVTVSGDGRNGVVVVKDTGIGIDPADQPHIFERFYRGDKSHSKAIGGTGLGLSIVKHAVQYHQGRIELQSEKKKGTVITVRIPRG